MVLVKFAGVPGRQETGENEKKTEKATDRDPSYSEGAADDSRVDDY